LAVANDGLWIGRLGETVKPLAAASTDPLFDGDLGLHDPRIVDRMKQTRDSGDLTAYESRKRAALLKLLRLDDGFDTGRKLQNRLRYIEQSHPPRRAPGCGPCSLQ